MHGVKREATGHTKQDRIIITDGYQLSGASNNGYQNMAFTGGFAVAAMANSQTIADAFGTAVKKIQDSHWFPFPEDYCRQKR